MADFASSYTPTKKVILPSSTPGDERWIEILTEPPAAIQFAGVKTNMSQMIKDVREAQRLKQVSGDKTPLSPEEVKISDDALEVKADYQYEQALKLIKSWNFEDQGEPAPITVDNLQRLQKRDQEALFAELDKVKTGSAIDLKKKSESGTTSPATPVAK